MGTGYVRNRSNQKRYGNFLKHDCDNPFCALAYRFPARLPVTALEKWLFRLVCSSMLALEGYVLLVRLRWFAQGYVEYRPAWMDHFLVGGLVWAMVIFARQYFTARAGSEGWPAARRRSCSGRPSSTIP